MENWTKIQMSSSYGMKITYDFDHADTNIDEMFDGIKTCLMGLGYYEHTIYRVMKKLVEEYEEEHECKKEEC